MLSLFEVVAEVEVQRSVPSERYGELPSNQTPQVHLG